MKKPDFNLPNDMNKIYLDEKETLMLSELQCPHCKQVMIHPNLFKAWIKLRIRVGQPIIINSGYRCWDYHVALYKRLYDNWQDKITKQSYHLKGMALDLKVPKGLTISNFIHLAKWAGFTYTYIIDNDPLDGDIHADVR
ncbi:MAG: hypothetical protein ACOCQD_02585 [archaeon]